MGQWLSRLRIVHAVIAYETAFMLLIAYSFFFNPTTELFRIFSDDLGVTITPTGFGIASSLGALASVFVLRIPVKWQRQWYMLCATPLILYCVPLGYYLWATARSGIITVVCFGIYVSFVLLSQLTFGERSNAASVPANTAAD